MKTVPEARCEGRAWLFTSVKKADHEVAKVSCLGGPGQSPCPLFDRCRAVARDMQAGPHQYGLHGTWAGKLYGRHIKETA